MPAAVKRYSKKSRKPASKKRVTRKPSKSAVRRPRRSAKVAKKSLDKPGPSSPFKEHEKYLLKKGFKKVSSSMKKKISFYIMLGGRKTVKKEAVPEFYKILKAPRGRSHMQSVMLTAIVKHDGGLRRASTLRTLDQAKALHAFSRSVSGTLRRKRASVSKKSTKSRTSKTGKKSTKPKRKTSSKTKKTRRSSRK